jgi:hypothetical protein
VVKKCVGWKISYILYIIYMFVPRYVVEKLPPLVARERLHRHARRGDPLALATSKIGEHALASLINLDPHRSFFLFFFLASDSVRFFDYDHFSEIKELQLERKKVPLNSSGWKMRVEKNENQRSASKANSSIMQRVRDDSKSMYTCQS